jgi:plastocyanin
MRGPALVVLVLVGALAVLWLLTFTAITTYDAVAGNDMSDEMWEMMGDMGGMDGMMDGMMGSRGNGPDTTGSASGRGEVRIEDFRYEPTTLTVTPGTVVTWTSEDAAPHTATGAGFDTERLDKGESSEVTFNTPGTFEYICSYHPSMDGKIVVE